MNNEHLPSQEPLKEKTPGIRPNVSKAKKMIAVTGASIAALLGISNESEAQEKKYDCEWELNQGTMSSPVEKKVSATEGTATVEKNKVSATEGTATVLTVTTPQKPTNVLGLDPSWHMEWKGENACPGYPAGCGTWVISKLVTPADSGVHSITLENAGCDNNAQSFQLDVKPLEELNAVIQPAGDGVPVTAEEKQRYDEHIENNPDGRDFDLSAQFVWAPNMKATTRVALGGEMAFNARVGSKHFKLGAAIRATETGIPYAPELRSTQMQATETRVGASVRAAAVITAGKDDFFQLAPGLGLGPVVYHYDTQFVRDNAEGGTTWVAEDTQFAFDVEPRIDLSVAYKNIGVIGSFGVPITVVPVTSQVGGKSKDPRVTPYFGAGVIGHF